MHTKSTNQYYIINKEALNKRSREYTKANKERLSKLKKEYYLKHKEEIKRKRSDKRKDPATRIKLLCVGAKKRAKKNNIEFENGLADYIISNIDLDSCACCYKQLDYSTIESSRNMDWPSLDRLNNQLGYTFKNTKVICLECNLAKRDSSAELLTLLALYSNRQ